MASHSFHLKSMTFLAYDFLLAGWIIVSCAAFHSNQSIDNMQINALFQSLTILVALFLSLFPSLRFSLFHQMLHRSVGFMSVPLVQLNVVANWGALANEPITRYLAGALLPWVNSRSAVLGSTIMHSV